MRSFFTVPLLVLVALVAFASAASSPYYVIAPGGAYEIGPGLSVPDAYREELGRLAFTAVLMRPATWVEAARAGLHPHEELVPAHEVLPSGISQEEMNQINQRLIEESKLAATVVAMQAAGYPAAISGQGVEVINTMEGMPADGVLRPGDVIIGIDGQEIKTAIDLVDVIRRHTVGDQVRLSVIRNGEGTELEVGTRSAPDEPGRPVVGALINTRLFAADMPFNVQIDTGDVGGASAGLMLSLAVLDAITDGVLTRGHFVAGTGTIAPDGRVGPIGGAAQKVVAAEEAGATVFLVPGMNLDEARATARSAQVISVERFEDAVRALCGLQPAGGAPVEEPAPCARPRE